MSAVSQQLDQETAQLLEGFGQMWEQLASLSLDEKRAAMKSQEPWAPLEPVHACMEVQAGNTPCRLFRPTAEPGLPTLVYFHRGGWVLGSVDESERICREMARRLGTMVLSVEYPLAPENPFPAAINSALKATQWALDHIEEHGGNKSRVGVVGESAGGGLAAAVAAQLRGEVWCQLLLYPIMSCHLNTPAYEGCPDRHLLTYENMQAFVGAYLSDPAHADDPLASPLLTENLDGVPPTYLLTAEFDPLHTEGTQYAERLKEAGVPCEEVCVPEAIHGFLDLPIREDLREQSWEALSSWFQEQQG